MRHVSRGPEGVGADGDGQGDRLRPDAADRTEERYGEMHLFIYMEACFFLGKSFGPARKIIE